MRKANSNDFLYLPHLDGLRCVALFGVLTFHFKIRTFTGGYSGVDMFFVLSGYLITRNIRNEILNEKFSLFKFYKKRFFRIHPALTATIFLTMMFSVTFSELKTFEPVYRSSSAALLFHANIYFRRTCSYFNNVSESKPLLHTWSLSVEEQFYTIWAIFLLIIYKIRHREQVVGLVFLLSFLFAIITAQNFPIYSFFELPCRLFQFCAGSLTSFLNEKDIYFSSVFTNERSVKYNTSEIAGLVPTQGNMNAEKNKRLQIFSQLANNIFSLLSFSIVLGSFIFLPKEANPVRLLPITIATCGLINSERSWLSKSFLSNRKMVFFGKMSYVIYLTHFPTICIVKQIFQGWFLRDISPAFLFPVIMCNALLLNRVVEAPFRSSPKRQAIYVPIFIAFIIALSLRNTNKTPIGLPLIPKSSGLPNETSISFLHEGVRKENQKVLENKYRLFKFSVGDRNGSEENIIFIGDSFAYHLIPCLNFIAKKLKVFFHVHFAHGSPFVQRNASGFAKMSNFWNHVNDLYWTIVDSTEPNVKVFIANNYEEKFDAQETEYAIDALYDDFTQINRTIYFLGHPSGIEESTLQKYVRCRELAFSVAWNISQMWREREFRGAKRCLALLKDGRLPPRDYLWYNEIIRKAVERKKNACFVDLSKSTCNQQSSGGREEVLCSVPPQNQTVIYDIGYMQDGYHLTSAGAYHLRDYLEHYMFEGYKHYNI